MKGYLIGFLILALCVFGIYEAVNWYDNLPDVKATASRIDAQEKWEESSYPIAHGSNDTKILKALSLDALSRGADPSCNWFCDDTDLIYKSSHARYEALIEK